MKELDNQDLFTRNTSIEVLQKKRQKQEYKLIDRIVPNKGHRVFEINEVTLEIAEATHRVQKQITWWDALRMIENPNYKKEIQVKKDCIYISALNAKSAMRRFIEGKGSSIRVKESK